MELETEKKLQHIQETNIKRLQLYSQLFLYGDFIPLNFYLDPQQTERELLPFQNSWTPYNIQRGDTGRLGLSITSLDGKLGGQDMQSLYQYSQESGRKISENDYNQLTPVYDQVLTLKPILDYYRPELGRTRFVRMKAGGFFPTHRDHSVNFQVPDYFRLFVGLQNTGRDKLFFIYDGQVINYEPGRVYLFNALKTHTVFSTMPEALIISLSLRLNQSAIVKTLAQLEIK